MNEKESSQNNEKSIKQYSSSSGSGTLINYTDTTGANSSINTINQNFHSSTSTTCAKNKMEDPSETCERAPERALMSPNTESTQDSHQEVVLNHPEGDHQQLCSQTDHQSREHGPAFSTMKKVSLEINPSVRDHDEDGASGDDGSNSEHCTDDVIRERSGNTNSLNSSGGPSSPTSGGQQINANNNSKVQKQISMKKKASFAANLAGGSPSRKSRPPNTLSELGLITRQSMVRNDSLDNNIPNMPRTQSNASVLNQRGTISNNQQRGTLTVQQMNMQRNTLRAGGQIDPSFWAAGLDAKTKNTAFGTQKSGDMQDDLKNSSRQNSKNDGTAGTNEDISNINNMQRLNSSLNSQQSAMSDIASHLAFTSNSFANDENGLLQQTTGWVRVKFTFFWFMFLRDERGAGGGTQGFLSSTTHLRSTSTII